MFFGWTFLASVVAGIVAASTGMGGGIILIPFLTYLGWDIKYAIAVSNISLIAVSNAASFGNIKRHMPNLRVASFLEMFAIVGAFLGGLITLILPKQALFISGGVFFVVCAAFFWIQRKEEKQCPLNQDDLSRKLGWHGSYYDQNEGKTLNYKGRNVLLASLCMAMVGFASTLLGFGGNALAILICDRVIGLPFKVSLTTSSLIVGLIALAGVNVYLEAGLINPTLVVSVIPGVIIGSLLGSKLLVYFSNRVVRIVFFLLLIILGFEMVFTGIQSKL